MTAEPDAARAAARRPRCGPPRSPSSSCSPGSSSAGSAARPRASSPGCSRTTTRPSCPRTPSPRWSARPSRQFSDSDTLPYLVVVERADGAATDPARTSRPSARSRRACPASRSPSWGRAPPSATTSSATRRPHRSRRRTARRCSSRCRSTPRRGAAGRGRDVRPRRGRRGAARRDRDATLVPAGLEGYVGGPGGLIADFATAFAGIDGILLGVALLVVLVILLVVYRSPILPFAVLLSAVFGLGAASLVVYQLALNDVITLSGQSQGILFILVVGAVDRLRPAARQPLQGGAARRAELVGRAQAGVARVGRADRRVGGDGHPRPALPPARRAAEHLRSGPGRCARHRRRPARVADLPPGRPAALRPPGVLAVRPQARPRARGGRRRHQGPVGPGRRPRRPAPAAHLGGHPRRPPRRRGVRPDVQGQRVDHRRDLPRRHRLDHRASR